MLSCEATTHPVRQVDLALLRNEFKHTSMCLLSVLGAIDQLEEHRVRDVQACKLVERTRWQEHFAAMVGILAVWARQHSDGVAAEVFIEAPCRSATTHGLVCSHGVVFAVEVGVELGMLVHVAWVVG